MLSIATSTERPPLISLEVMSGPNLLQSETQVLLLKPTTVSAPLSVTVLAMYILYPIYKSHTSFQLYINS